MLEKEDNIMQHLPTPTRHTLHNLGSSYDFRAPPMVGHLGLLGIVLLALAALLAVLIPSLPAGLPIVMLVIGAPLLLLAIIAWSIIAGLNRIRFGVRNRMVNTIPWRGDERVLDVGTGSGITLMGCAHKLTSGKGVGIDIWTPNSGGGTAEMFWRNANHEGVADRVELQNVDAREMPFPDASFDMVVSSFALHHIADNAGGLERSIREILRVTKPGGTITLYDITPMIAAASRTLEKSGLTVQQSRNGTFRMLTARKGVNP